MTCEELQPLYVPYALGVLSADEAAPLEEHLRRVCDVCTPEVRAAIVQVAELAALAPQVDPPARLRRRVLASVKAEPSGALPSWIPAWPWIAVLAGLTAAVVMLGMQKSALTRELAATRRATDIVALLEEPDTREVSFGEAAPKPRGHVLVNPKRGVLLISTNLPQAPAGKTYEMWLVPKAGAPRPAGLFVPDARGVALHAEQTPVALQEIAAVAVSLENAGGTTKPTQMVFAVKL